METAPEYFVEVLEREFNGRLRIRWSLTENKWLIEQKVARGVMWPDKPILESDDEALAIRDGYFHVLSITPGDRTRCKACNTTLHVPITEIRVVTCPVCKMLGRTYSTNCGFFPLNDDLITYLKSIDPEKGMGSEQIKRLRNNNEKLAQSMQRSVTNQAESYGLDEFNKIVGIPQFGATKAEKWLDAPEKEISNERQKKGIAHKERFEDGTPPEQIQGPTIVVA